MGPLVLGWKRVLILVVVEYEFVVLDGIDSEATYTGVLILVVVEYEFVDL